MLTRLTGREDEAVGLTGLVGLLELACGIGGRGWLFAACRVVCEVDAAPVGAVISPNAAGIGSSVFTTEYFTRRSPILALRRLIGIRFIRRSIRDRRSED